MLGTVEMSGTFSITSDDADVVGHGAAVCDWLHVYTSGVEQLKGCDNHVGDDDNRRAPSRSANDNCGAGYDNNVVDYHRPAIV